MALYYLGLKAWPLGPGGGVQLGAVLDERDRSNIGRRVAKTSAGR